MEAVPDSGYYLYLSILTCFLSTFFFYLFFQLSVLLQKLGLQNVILKDTAT
jgi:hypothetical protein